MKQNIYEHKYILQRKKGCSDTLVGLCRGGYDVGKWWAMFPSRVLLTRDDHVFSLSLPRIIFFFSLSSFYYILMCACVQCVWIYLRICCRLKYNTTLKIICRRGCCCYVRPYAIWRAGCARAWLHWRNLATPRTRSVFVFVLRHEVGLVFGFRFIFFQAHRTFLHIGRTVNSLLIVILGPVWVVIVLISCK